MYVAIDLGGTNTRVLVTHSLTSVRGVVMFPTPHSPEKAFEMICHFIDMKSKGERVNMIVMGVPGVLRDDGEIFSLPNLKCYASWNFKSAFEWRYKCETALLNDAALVALGEAVYGAGKGASIVAYLTISTGVGGARIVDGKIDVSRFTFEPGKALYGDRSYESLVSGKAFIARFHTHPRLVRAARIWLHENKLVGDLVATTISFWSPHRVVLGGSMVRDISIAEVKQEAVKHLRHLPEVSEVVRGTLGDFGGIWGGLAYIKNTQV